MKKSHVLRNTIIGTVIGGIIVSILQWLTGFLSIIWENILKHEIVLPIWLILIFLTMVVTSTFLITINTIKKVISNGVISDDSQVFT